MWEAIPFLPRQKSQGSWRPLSCMVQGEGATKQKMGRARRGEGKERRRQRTSMHQRRPLQLQLMTRTVTVTLRENVSPSAQDSRRHHPAKDLAPSHWPCIATHGDSEFCWASLKHLILSWVERNTTLFFSLWNLPLGITYHFCQAYWDSETSFTKWSCIISTHSIW